MISQIFCWALAAAPATGRWAIAWKCVCPPRHQSWAAQTCAGISFSRWPSVSWAEPTLQLAQRGESLPVPYFFGCSWPCPPLWHQPRGIVVPPASASYSSSEPSRVAEVAIAFHHACDAHSNQVHVLTLLEPNGKWWEVRCWLKWLFRGVRFYSFAWPTTHLCSEITTSKSVLYWSR